MQPPCGFSQIWIRGNPAHRAGTCCWIRSDIRHRALLKYRSPLPESRYVVELIAVQVADRVIAGSYMSPQTPPDVLEATLSLFANYHRCLVVGDLNARHRVWCTTDKPRGRRLVQIAQRDGWAISSATLPTFVKSGCPEATSTIDICLTKGVHCTAPEIVDPLPSGHRPQIVSLIGAGQPLPRWRRAYNSGSCRNAANFYQEKGPKLYERLQSTTLSPNLLCEEYTNFLLRPFRRTHSYTSPARTDLDDQLVALCRRKRVLLSEGRKVEANRVRRRIRSLTRSRKRHTASVVMEDIPTETNRIATRMRKWQASRAEGCTLGYQMDPDTYMVFLQGRCGPEDVQLAEPTDNQLPQDFATRLASCIGKLPNRKAVGSDAIRSEFMKLAPALHASFLTLILSRSLATGSLPSAWRSAIVRPLLKPTKDPSEAASYRPVCLLSHARKAIEATLLTYLLESYRPSECQYAYIPGKAVETALKRVDRNIQNGYDSAFIDLTGAFDCVDKWKVKRKLRDLQLQPSVLEATLHMLSSQLMRVKVGNTLSGTFETTSGVPQGGCLSPVLFLMVMDPLASSVERVGCACTMFSDDVSFQGTPKAIEDSLAVLAVWAEEFDMKVSVAKSWSLSTSQITYYYRNSPLPSRRSGKYLGIHLDSCGLNSEATVAPRVPLIRARVDMLRGPLLVNRTTTHPVRLRNHYLTFVCGSVRYGEHLMSRMSITQLRDALAEGLQALFKISVSFDTLRALIRFRQIGTTKAERMAESATTERVLARLSRTAPATNTTKLLKLLPTHLAWFVLQYWAGKSPDPRILIHVQRESPNQFEAWTQLIRCSTWNPLQRQAATRLTTWVMQRTAHHRNDNGAPQNPPP